MLSAACAKFEKARSRTEATGRSAVGVDIAAFAVEAALISTAWIATDILLSPEYVLPRIGLIAMHLTEQVEAFRRIRPNDITRPVRTTATAANAVHLYLTRGTLRDITHDDDLDPARLRDRLKIANAAMETAVQAMLGDVDAVDGYQLYLLLMAPSGCRAGPLSLAGGTTPDLPPELCLYRRPCSVC